MKPDAVDRAARKLMKAARAALRAQDRAAYWQQFGTNSSHAKKAGSRHDEAMAALDRAEADMEEALQHYNRI